MNPKPTIKKTSVKNEKIVVVHDCNQIETLRHLTDNTNKLSVIITGNGDPEKGIARKVAIIGERQEVMVTKISDIHDTLKDYHEKVEEAKTAALTAKSAFEKYQASLEGEAKGIATVSTRRQVTFNNAVSVISTILILVGLIITYLVGKEDTRTLDNKINDLGTPVIINARGMPSKLPVGDSLKFFRDGQFKDTIRDKETQR